LASRVFALVLGFGLLQFATIGSASATRPTEYFDEHTGATVTVVGKPIVFARDRGELAANARDYVTLAAASVDRSGKVNYVLLAYFWSTLGDRSDLDTLPTANTLVLLADDRLIRLALEGHTAQEAGIDKPVHAPPGNQAPPRVFHTDLDTLRFLGVARRIVVQSAASDPAGGFEIWDDGRVELAAFVRFVSGES
jgi:hypothetical protein